MEFTSLFFQNFIGIASIPFQTLGTTQSSASMGGTSTFITAAESLTSGVNQFSSDEGNTLAGSTSVISATATVASYLQVHDIDYPNVEMTKAYVESLTEEELNDLISNLSEKQEELEYITKYRNNNDLYVGNIGIHGSYAANSAISNCDVLFSIGTRFNDRITGKIEEFAANAKIVHIDIDAASISRNIVVDVPIVADAKKAICALLEKAKPLHISEWTDEINHWKMEYPIDMGKVGLTPQMIIQSINDVFEDAVITTDVGQNQLWTTQFLDIDENKQMLTSGGLGTMGYGFPAAIGAKLGNPDKDVIVISGDGGMQMNIQEMATAIVYELPVIICILNNGYLGNVRQWQEMFYDRRYSSTCMRYRRSCETGCNTPNHCCPEYTPNFIALAESYGAKGIRVTKAEDIKTALISAKQNTKTPTVIEFIIDREINVMPIVPPGNSLNDMILESEEITK